MAEPDDQPAGASTASGDAATSPDAHPRAAALAGSMEERQKWEAQAQLQDWTPSTQPPVVEPQAAGGLLRQMFFGNLGSKKGAGSSKESR